MRRRGRRPDRRAVVAQDVEPQGLTDAAAETWTGIRDAALSCDYDRLAAIAGENEDDGAFVWPRVHVEPEDDSAWEELLAVYPPEAIEEWRGGGSGYLGYRTSIGEDGTWRYFIAGD